MTELEAERSEPLSAGAQLRAERERQGLHIAALAVTLKIAPRKLDALENDRYGDLPGLPFTRALAISVCRALKIDAAPILARLPEIAPQLGRFGSGLNTPLPARGPRTSLGGRWPRQGWAVLAPLALVVAAAVLLWLPQEWLPAPPSASAPGDPTSSPPSAALAEGVTVAQDAAPAAAAQEPVLITSALNVPVESVSALLPEAPLANTAAASGLLIKTQARSWVEVYDARGRTLLSRLLLAGETVSVQGVLPLKVTVGNITATTLTWQGKAVNLGEHARDNVARLDLQ